MEKAGKWIPPELKSNADLYYRQVWKVTNQQPLHKLHKIEQRGLAGVDESYHIDHRISIKYGFENNIPPFLMGNVNNLEMLPWKDNIYKSSNCSSSLDELCQLMLQ